jgi:pectinesterase inhibitor-like protein
LESLCNSTQDSGFCVETLGSYPRSEGETAASLTDLTGYVVSAAMDAVNRTYDLGRDLFEARNGTKGELAVLQDCVELLDQSMDSLKDSRDLLRHLDVASRGKVMDVRVGLSAAYTDQDTCWDEFGDLGGGKVADRMSKEGGSIAPLLSLALSFALTVQNHSPATVYIPLLAPSPSP